MIFVLYHHLVNLYQVCSNNAPGVKNGPPRGHMFYIGLYKKNKKKNSCVKPDGLDYGYLVFSITLWTSTKFVQIIAGARNGLAQGSHMFYISLYRENVNKTTSLKQQNLEPGQLLCNITLLASSKYVQIITMGHIVGRPRVHRVRRGQSRENIIKNF